ncbi:MAG TPA: hypothetical protein VFZ98_01605 [Vicinamibacterales bacterium]
MIAVADNHEITGSDLTADGCAVGCLEVDAYGPRFDLVGFIDHEDAGFRARSIDRVDWHGERASQLLQGDAGVGIHSRHQLAARIRYVDFDEHGPGLLIETIGKSGNGARKRSADRLHMNADRLVDVNQRHRGLGHRDAEAQDVDLRQPYDGHGLRLRRRARLNHCALVGIAPGDDPGERRGNARVAEERLRLVLVCLCEVELAVRRGNRCLCGGDLGFGLPVAPRCFVEVLLGDQFGPLLAGGGKPLGREMRHLMRGLCALEIRLRAIDFFGGARDRGLVLLQLVFQLRHFQNGEEISFLHS